MNAPVLEVFISPWLLGVGVVGAGVVAMPLCYWAIRAFVDDSVPLNGRIATASVAVATSATFALVLVVWLRRRRPVMRIWPEMLEVHHQLFYREQQQIPLSHVLRAYACWQGCSSDEYAPTLVIEIDDEFDWNRRLFSVVGMTRRRRYELPLDAVLLEYFCSNCQPQPVEVAQVINSLLHEYQTPPAAEQREAAG